MSKLSAVEDKYLKKVPEIKPGDVVRVHQKIKEGGKERIQIFEGVVLRVKGGGIKTTFLVRKLSFSIGVEKNYLLHSPNIVKIEIKKRSNVRQAYLTYLRDLKGKSARLKDKQFDMLAVNIKEEKMEEEVTGEVKDDNTESSKKEKVTDADLTELSEEQIVDVEKSEVPLSEIEKAEEKSMEAEDKKDEDMEDSDHQVDEKKETEAGVEKADQELEKGKSTEGEKKELVVEEKEIV